MYLRRLTIDNVRAIRSFSLEFEKGREPGWHVILGSNGAGKSSLVRSFALLMMGEKEAYASRQVFSNWISDGSSGATISGHVTWDEKFDALRKGGQPPRKAITPTVTLDADANPFQEAVEPVFGGDLVTRTIWGGGSGWFSASFGPFRRFTGGDRIYDRLFVSNKRLAPHLTALGEDVALTEALDWLGNLYIEILQNERSATKSSANQILPLIEDFINSTGFLPFGAKIVGYYANAIQVRDGGGAEVRIDQLSDGYRSALSLALELIRQMVQLYGADKVLDAYDYQTGSISAPGVVAIDEVDVHLHPTWQRDIGRWLIARFPQVQFIVTTHSPIVCRAVADRSGEITGTIWRLPQPGVRDDPRAGQVLGSDLETLAFGDVLDAFDTELFGEDVTRSSSGSAMLDRLAWLNNQALSRDLSPSEQLERKRLRARFPSFASDLP